MSLQAFAGLPRRKLITVDRLTTLALATLFAAVQVTWIVFLGWTSSRLLVWR